MIELLLSTYILLNLITVWLYIYRYKGFYSKQVLGDICLRLIFGCFIFAANLINKK